MLLRQVSSRLKGLWHYSVQLFCCDTMAELAAFTENEREFLQLTNQVLFQTAHAVMAHVLLNPVGDSIAAAYPHQRASSI